MGIQGLLPLLKDSQVAINVAQYKGQTLGIDGYVWLHRGAYGCAEKLVMGQQTTQYTNYAMHRIRMLKHHGITPFVVFDGDRLPSKAGTEEEREARRRDNLTRAKSMVKDGRRASTFEAFAKCIDITPEMAYQLIKCLKAEGVSYIVAPYEADAQLAYLEKTGIIDAVVTEDSDLLVFGCHKVLFKMDSNGDCIEILSSRITACRTLSFSGWTSDLFRQMAILSGCDYLPSITGMGLKNAHRLLQRYKTVRKVLQAVRLEGKMRIPADYQIKFEQAEKTFLFQRVWCPRTEQLTTLNALKEDEVAMDYVGPNIAPGIARGIACGAIDPISRLPMVDIAKSFQPGSRKPAVATSSASSFRRSTSSDRPQQPILPSGQTTLSSLSKRPIGLKAVKTASLPTMKAARQPLGAVDANVTSALARGKMTKKSPFFGGQREPVTSPNQPVYDDAMEDVDAAVMTKHPNASQSPISGIGDYFCELDGADPRLWISGDEGRDAAHCIDPRSEVEAATLNDKDEEDGDETFDWVGKDCASDVSSEGASTTPKKSNGWRETSYASSAFSSPCTDPGEGTTSPNKAVARVAKQESAICEAKARVHPEAVPASPMEDVISSPVQEVEVAGRDGGPRPSPESPTAFRKEPTRHMSRKRSLQTYHSEMFTQQTPIVENTANVKDDIGYSQIDANANMWARYSHKPASSADVNVTPLRARTALRTPNNRPLRLYACQSPAENMAFALTSASGPGGITPLSTTTSACTAQNSIAPVRRALSFETTPAPTSGIKRLRVNSPDCTGPPPKLTTSRSCSSSTFPLPNSTPSAAPSEAESNRRLSPSLAAFRYSEQRMGESKKTALTPMQRKSLTLGTLPRSRSGSQSNSARSASLSAANSLEAHGRREQAQKHRSVLHFASAPTIVARDSQRPVESGEEVISRASVARPSLERFKFRSS